MTTGSARLAALATGIVCLLIAEPSAAAWHRIDSPNFVVVGDVSAKELRDVAVRFEGFREALSNLLTQSATVSAVPTVVLVFPSDRAFTPFKPLHQGKPVKVDGFFLPGADVNHIAMASGYGDVGLRVIFHEYAHLVVSNVARNLPLWLNEGLAQYYSTFAMFQGGREAQIGRFVGAHVQTLNKTLLSLDEMLAVTHDSPLYNEGERRGVFYAQSWALTHFLIHGRPDRSGQLTSLIEAAESGVTAVEAWRKVFADERMDRALQNYVRQTTFQYRSYTFSEKLGTFEGKPIALNEADAQAFMAALLLRQGRHEEATQRVAQILRLSPSHERANVVMAAIDIEQKRLEEAQKRLRSLSGSSDWLIAYDAAVGLGKAAGTATGESDGDLDLARQFLNIVERNRGDVPNALARLARLELMSSIRPSSESLAGVARARTLAPGRLEYALLHAEILARHEEYASARSVLGPLLSPAYPPGIRDPARRLMVSIVERETRRPSLSSASVPSVPSTRSTPLNPSTLSDPARQPLPSVDIGSPGRPIIKPVFRVLEAGEQRLDGRLDRIECSASGGAVFYIRTPDGEDVAEANRMSEVQFITYRDDLKGKVLCGPISEPWPVYLTWRAGKSPGAKVVVAIEVLPF